MFLFKKLLRRESRKFFEFIYEMRLIIITTFIRQLRERFVFLFIQVMTNIEEAADTRKYFRRSAC